MTTGGEDRDVSEIEFLVRHRLPRPISRAYEAVCFALDETEAGHRAEWAAMVALRWVAALRGAVFLSEQKNPGPVNPPDPARAHRIALQRPLPPGLADPVPFALARLARIHGAPLCEPALPALRRALGCLAYLASGRLVVRTGSGLRLLLGPRIEVPLPSPHAQDGQQWEAAGCTALFVDPNTGRWVSLDPLVTWLDVPNTAFGRLLVLRRVAGLTGHYVEDGSPGCPGHTTTMANVPLGGRLRRSPELLASLRQPPARFNDSSPAGDTMQVHGLVWRGGTSDIYAATGPDGRALVLKTFEYPGVFDENFWRFRNEEGFARDVRHPRVIHPRNLDLPGLGTVQVQPRIQRGALEDLLATNGVLALPDAIALTEQLVDALVAVHAVGVVHNDVKPDNLLFDDAGQLHLIDFGIAHRPSPRRRALRPGVPPGSPGYVAPELRAGELPSWRSDLYACGAVLHRMLFGVVPNAGPGQDSPAWRAVPISVTTFLQRCLAERPQQRYSDAAEALADLRALAPGLRALSGVALDIEGTLVGSYHDRRVRPGLLDFLEHCLARFDRVFIYTMLSHQHAWEVLGELARAGAAPSDLLERVEYVVWPRGADGGGKDLRRCRLPVPDCALVDDTAAVIPEDQRHRWVPVPDFGAAGPYDRGLVTARLHLKRLFSPALVLPTS